MALGELNKNVTKVGKLLGKVSTGTKLTSAKDSASGWAISEKMREQIRSLLQDNQNVQNGASLVRTADGGIDEIVQELRHMKELAINAANDSNSDEDRRIIQREFDKKLENIDDIASETNYNGIPLLDGRWKRIKVSTVNGGGGGTNNVTGLFANSGLSTGTATPGKTAQQSLWVNGKGIYEGDRNRPYLLDFTAAVNSLGNTPTVPDEMDEQGFYVVCAGLSTNVTPPATQSRFPGCPHSHAFIFDADMAVGTGVQTRNTEKDCLITRVGIAGLTSLTELPAALFEGTRAAQGQTTGNSVVINNGDKVTLTKNDDDTYSIKRNYGMWICDEEFPSDSRETVTTSEGNPLIIHHGTKQNQHLRIFINDMHTKRLKGDVPNMEDIARMEKSIPADCYDDYTEELHENGASTPKAIADFLNDYVQNLAASDPDYRASKQYNDYQSYHSLVEDAARITLNNAKVTTQKNANVTIRNLDSALEYALDEATYMGAYVQRLEMLGNNITINEENTQAAESTIRDADMAKEMTEYTKQNVLLQASQSMLAQANQNAGSVLSLLQ